MVHRCFTMALALAALTAAAQAQTGPGTIYYRYGSAYPQPVYRVSGTGANNTQIGPFSSTLVQSTALTTYPGGRQFVTDSGPLGPIPGITGDYGDIVLCSEQGTVTKTVTNFRGPQFVDWNGIRARLSNDQQDSFLSFVAYDTRNGLWTYYRYNGPISDFFQPDFEAFVPDDPRLIPLMYMTAAYRYRQFWSWDPTGRWLTFSDNDAAGRPVISVYDTASNTSTEVNNPALSGLTLTYPWSSSTEFRFFGPATYKDGTKGIASLDPATGRWGWVIKEGGKGTNQISAFRQPAVSPDGTTLAFGMLRVVNRKTTPSLVRISVNGGSYTPILNLPPSTTNPIEAGALGWKW